MSSHIHILIRTDSNKTKLIYFKIKTEESNSSRNKNGAQTQSSSVVVIYSGSLSKFSMSDAELLITIQKILHNSKNIFSINNGISFISVKFSITSSILFQRMFSSNWNSLHFTFLKYILFPPQRFEHCSGVYFWN